MIPPPPLSFLKIHPFWYPVPSLNWYIYPNTLTKWYFFQDLRGTPLDPIHPRSPPPPRIHQIGPAPVAREAKWLPPDARDNQLGFFFAPLFAQHHPRDSHHFDYPHDPQVHNSYSTPQKCWRSSAYSGMTSRIMLKLLLETLDRTNTSLM